MKIEFIMKRGQRVLIDGRRPETDSWYTRELTGKEAWAGHGYVFFDQANNKPYLTFGTRRLVSLKFDVPTNRLWDYETEPRDMVAQFVGERVRLRVTRVTSDRPVTLVSGERQMIDECTLYVLGDTDPGAVPVAPEGEEQQDEVGDWTLTLRYRGVPRSEVERVAEDCTNSGDHPAEEFEIS